MVNFEKCNEMKIVERRKKRGEEEEECVSRHHHSSRDEQVKRSTTACWEGKKANDDYHLIDTKSQLEDTNAGG